MQHWLENIMLMHLEAPTVLDLRQVFKEKLQRMAYGREGDVIPGDLLFRE